MTTAVYMLKLHRGLLSIAYYIRAYNMSYVFKFPVWAYMWGFWAKIGEHIKKGSSSEHTHRFSGSKSIKISKSLCISIGIVALKCYAFISAKGLIKELLKKSLQVGGKE